MQCQGIGFLVDKRRMAGPGDIRRLRPDIAGEEPQLIANQGLGKRFIIDQGA